MLLPGLDSLRDRFHGAQPGWLAFAALLEILSCVSYVMVFRGVFCDRMSWRTSAEIGLAELAANSLFSVGGAGGLALGAWILRRGGLPRDYIAHRTVAFFLITSLANVTFLAIGGLGLATGILHGEHNVLLGLLPAVAAVLIIVLALGAGQAAGALQRRSMRAKLAAAAGAVGDGVGEAMRLLKTGDPMIYVGAAGYMLFDVAMLGVCFTAFGHDVPPAGVLLVAYIVGQLGGLIPIPGGHRRRRRRPDRHARALRGRPGRRGGGRDRLPRAAAHDPGAARPARARHPAQAAPGRGARHRRLRSRSDRRGAGPRRGPARRAGHDERRMNIRSSS